MPTNIIGVKSVMGLAVLPNVMANTAESSLAVNTYRVSRRRRIGIAKDNLKLWLKDHPILERFVYSLYLAVLLPFFVLVYTAAGIAIAIEWVANQIKLGVKRWRERHLLKPEEVARRKREREARYAVRDMPRKRKRRLTLGERKVAIRDELEVEPGVATVPDPGNYRVVGAKKKRKLVYGCTATETGQLTIDQLGKSHFWRFPFEIREMIWKYAVGGHHIHIVRRRGRLGNVYCPADDPTDPLWRHLCLETRDEHGFYKPTAWPVDVRPLSLLLSCRQMYSTSPCHTSYSC